MTCIKCKKNLTSDEIGLHKKLINRGAKEFMCINCISEYFRIPVPSLKEKIEYFKKIGCILF